MEVKHGLKKSIPLKPVKDLRNSKHQNPPFKDTDSNEELEQKSKI